jgi:hypothetical protein
MASTTRMRNRADSTVFKRHTYLTDRPPQYKRILAGIRYGTTAVLLMVVYTSLIPSRPVDIACLWTTVLLSLNNPDTDLV